jgi:hypothetical protein
MSLAQWILMGVAFVAAWCIWRLAVAVNFFLKYSGQRVVTCPETRRPAAVRVGVGRAALKILAGPQRLRLSECSRWPERAGCGQECLSQIEAAPEGCLVRNIVARWYAGKECVYCHKPFGEINWLDHKPALMDPELKTVQWDQVPAEHLPDVLATHLPVCWNCHVVESFRREHSDLIVERPWRRAG